MQVCIVYDCLFPYTIGGAERWYRNLAEHLAARGDTVTFLTLRQWERGVEADVPGVHVIAAAPRMDLYRRSGRRRLAPPILFGLGVLWHLLRHGRRYDVVHTASFPYFSLLAVGVARGRGRYRIVVDWHEVWSSAYWREYLGRLGGRVGWTIQRRCLRIQQRAFCFSQLHERRLRELGLRGELTRLEGQYAGPVEVLEPLEAGPVVVFAGRHVPEKRVLAIPPAIAEARKQLPDLRGEIYGDGPERARVIEAIRELGMDGYVTAPGFVDGETMERALSSALCLLLPSAREGYGLVVIEAAARGVPVVVVAGPDNAATELVEEGVSGVVAASAEPEELARALVTIDRAGSALRRSTVEWFRENAGRLSLERSLEIVSESYSDDAVASS